MDFITYTDDFKSTEAILLECQIACAEAINKYKYESAMYELHNNDFIIESNNNSKGITGVITSIINAIRRMFASIFDGMAKFIGGKDANMTPEEFLKSQTAKEKLDYDLNKAGNLAESEINANKSLINKILSGQKVSRDDIIERKNSAKNFLTSNKGMCLITGAVAAIAYGRARKIYKKIDAEKNGDYDNLNPEAKQDVQSLWSNISNICADFMRMTDSGFRVFAKNAKKSKTNISDVAETYDKARNIVSIAKAGGDKANRRIEVRKAINDANKEVASQPDEKEIYKRNLEQWANEKDAKRK